jgi:CRISPR-associated protein Cas7/Csd2 subtype I-C
MENFVSVNDAVATDVLNHKIDIVGYVSVHNSNPNGDIDDGNRPRTYSDGYGWISDVCLKHKIRDNVAVQHKDVDELLMSSKVCKARNLPFNTLKERIAAQPEIEAALKAKLKKGVANNPTELAEAQWFDVRSFGHIFTEVTSGVGSRGCVIVSPAVSLDVVDIEEYTHTKEVSLQDKKKDKAGNVTDNDDNADTVTRGSDTIGSSSYVKYGVYKFHASINAYQAEINKFTNDDAKMIIEAIAKNLWENDEARARPDITVERLYVIEHETKLGNVSKRAIDKAVTTKLVNVDALPEFDKNEYVYDDSVLMNMTGVHVRKFVNGVEQ